MTIVSYQDTKISIGIGESVLDALLSRGVNVPYGCRAGVCQSCLVQAKNGVPPLAAQKGLKETLRQQNYFLSCSCFPEQDLVIGEIDSSPLPAVVKRLRHLSPQVVEVQLTPSTRIPYYAGQFITLWCDLTGDWREGRCYSLASVPELDESLIIQVAKAPGGKVSGWIHDQLREGQEVFFQEPMGACFFVPESIDQSILLAASGAGLSPLYGILRDALHKGHAGEIHLFHRASEMEELYLNRELLEFSANHVNFHYHPSLSENAGSAHVPMENIQTMIAESIDSLKNWQVYLCGSPILVNSLRKQTYLAGASMNQIFSDAFVSKHEDPLS